MRTVYMYTLGGVGGFFIGVNSPTILIAMASGLIWGSLIGYFFLRFVNEDGSLKRHE